MYEYECMEDSELTFSAWTSFCHHYGNSTARDAEGVRECVQFATKVRKFAQLRPNYSKLSFRF